MSCLMNSHCGLPLDHSVSIEEITVISVKRMKKKPHKLQFISAIDSDLRCRLPLHDIPFDP